MRDDFEGMPVDVPVEWYIGRDGQQYGPLTDEEMRRFRELGHLQMNDLLWREGFADWMPAGAVFDIAKKALG